MLTSLTYDQIQVVAEQIAKEYRLKNDVPPLPSGEILSKYQHTLDSELRQLSEEVKSHISRFEPEGGHGYEHLEYVALAAGYFAENECNSQNVGGDEKEVVIKMSMVTGLLHDVDRHLGFEEEHMIEAEKTTRQILGGLGVDMGEVEKISTVVRNHDHFDFSPDDKITQIIFGSVFDPDHFRWGLEREDTFWRMKEKRGMPANEVIHYYKYLYDLRNAWKTELGRDMGTKYVDFGLAIALGVEKRFS